MSKFDKNKQRAAALRYDINKDKAPIVVASGSGAIANKIIDVANKNEIPVYHDDSAASILSQLNIGSEVPAELYQVIVEIYVSILKTAESYQKKHKELYEKVSEKVNETHK